ncbi:MAG: ribonuclease HII [Clostridia bacterium]|nr:ribonuclease HII [Clostridia bacterium]
MTWEFELPYRERYPLLCGVDEAGRGPLCGPVVAGAVILPDSFDISALNDSKKLSEKKREALYEQITASCDWAAGIATPEEIDAYNILNATFLAMCRAVEGLKQTPSFALVDGNKIPKGLTVPALAVVKGDAKCPSVSAASVIAKVTRDRMMADLAAQYPQYELQKHKGYPTKEHYRLLLQHGIAPIYRQSFLKNLDQHRED